MVKNTDPRILKRLLSKMGPYLYYFNGKCSGINEEIVKQMTIFSNKYLC